MSVEVIKNIAENAIRLQQNLVTKFERDHFFPLEARRLKGILGNASSFLDVGSGRGYFADELHKTIPGSQVFCTDFDTKHKGKMAFVSASASALPFPANSFDVTTLFYVLHHTNNPDAVLNEAKRVSNIIIVQEDSYSNLLQKMIYRLHLQSYGLGSPSSGTVLRTDTDWLTLFEIVGLKVVDKHQVKKIGYPITRYEYFLQT